jgi:hypothetical protein
MHQSNEDLVLKWPAREPEARFDRYCGKSFKKAFVGAFLYLKER